MSERVARRHAPWTVLMERRKRAQFTQAQLACGIIPQTTLSQIERGERLPDLAMLEQFSERLQLSFSEMSKDWIDLFEKIHLLDQLWGLLCQLEVAANSAGESLRIQSELSNLLHRHTEQRLDEFCKFSYSGYVAARYNDNTTAERCLIKAWDTFPVSILTRSEFSRLYTVHALARVRVSKILGRTEPESYWRSRMPISFQHFG